MTAPHPVYPWCSCTACRWPTRRDPPSAATLAEEAASVRRDPRDFSELTPRQAEVLAYLTEYQNKHGFRPYGREVAARFGVTQWAVYSLLRCMRLKGFLRLDQSGRRYVFEVAS